MVVGALEALEALGASGGFGVLQGFEGRGGFGSLGGVGVSAAVLSAPRQCASSVVFLEALEASQALEASGRSQVILSGMETHICVAQTARDLLASALEVWVVADACLSRRRLDWELGLDRMRADGARVVTAEAALFELLGEAAGPIFKELSRRIR